MPADDATTDTRVDHRWSSEQLACQVDGLRETNRWLLGRLAELDRQHDRDVAIIQERDMLIDKLTLELNELRNERRAAG